MYLIYAFFGAHNVVGSLIVRGRSSSFTKVIMQRSFSVELVMGMTFVACTWTIINTC